jgi:tetratricopeptide (TPR) repeat protein
MKLKNKLLINNILSAFVGSYLLLQAPQAVAAPKPDMAIMRGQLQGSSAKIIFQWTKAGDFGAHLKGNVLTVTFDRNVGGDFSHVLSQLYPYVTSAQRKADGKTVIFTLDQPYTIRTFKKDQNNGVELIGLDPQKSRSSKKSPAAPPLAKPTSKPVMDTKAQKLDKLTPAAGEEKPVEQKPLQTQAKAEEKPPAAAEAKPEPKPIPVVAPVAQAETKPAASTDEKTTAPAAETQPAAAEEAPQEQTATAAPASPAVIEEVEPEVDKGTIEKVSDMIKSALNKKKISKEDKESAAKEDKSEAASAKPEDKKLTETELKPKEKKSVLEEPFLNPEKPADESVKRSDETPAKATDAAIPGALKVGISAADDSATLRFPFNERTASAVFIRSGMLWIVFNKHVALDLSDFNNLPQTVIGKAEIFPAQQVTALRMPVESTVFPTIAKEEGKFEWAILLTPKSRLISNALKVELKTDPPVPPHVFIPALEMSESFEITDPQVGDTLVITPSFKLGEGLLYKREFIDFTLLETAQGIVVMKKADDVQVLQQRNGLRISPRQGITLTPGLPTAASTDEKRPQPVLQSSSTLFPFNAWKVPEDKDRNKLKTELLQEIVSAKTVDDANRARLRLAQIFLSEGMAPEALGQLESISRTSIVFYRSAKLAAMHGAANFLMARYAEAARDFSASELNNNKEVDYWRSMLADLLGNPGQYSYMDINNDYISKYPPLFRQRLAIVAADRAVEAKEYNTALKVFDSLQDGNLLPGIQDYVNYLLAVISAATGQQDEAIEMWDKLAENHRAPFVQARAEFSRILWGMEQGTIDREKAIDRLERLRMAWHGDNMEMKVLGLLGGMYSERKDYTNAMRIWSGGVESFPNTPAAIEMARKMEDTFVAMFDEGIADTMPPLEVLTLFYQYKNQVPRGNVGNEIVNMLADKLVAVDLLDQAAALLDRQMRETEKEPRTEAGVKLATVHLLNRNPKKALLALQDSVYGEISQPLGLVRNRLLAEALSQLDKHDKALQVIANDISSDAESIRVGIFWQQKDWTRVISGVESILKARKDVTAPLTLDESDAVLKLALAYIFQDNRVQLQYLRDYFEPLLATNNPYKPLFNFITATEVEPTPTNFDDIMSSLSQTRSFVENYRARIKIAGLDAIGGTKK